MHWSYLEAKLYSPLICSIVNFHTVSRLKHCTDVPDLLTYNLDSTSLINNLVSSLVSLLNYVKIGSKLTQEITYDCMR